MEICDSTQQNKDRVRKAAKSRLSFLTWSYKREASEFITLKVKKIPEYRDAKGVMLYVSTEDEPDTEALIMDCFRNGRRVLVPRCKAAGEMEAVEIQSLDDLVPGRYGIREPNAELPPASASDIDFCAVPCLAACENDLGGYKRLGHGMGYYDRFLTGLKCPTCVLCFKELVRDVPVDERDVLIDIMVTE